MAASFKGVSVARSRNAKGSKSLKRKKNKATRPPIPPKASPKASTKASAKVPPVVKVPTPAQLPLQSAIDVRREQAKLYREMRGGALDHGKGAKMVWVLGEVRRTIETEDLETKLAELAKAAADQGLIK